MISVREQWATTNANGSSQPYSNPVTLTWKQLRSRVALFASALRAHGIKRGDRVAIVAGNSIDTLCVFLGATALGGMFSSSSADMGVKGVLERLKQIKPRWVFMDERLTYGGQSSDLREKIEGIRDAMRGVDGFQGVVVMPVGREGVGQGARVTDEKEEIYGDEVVGLTKFLSVGREGELRFERVGFGEGFLIVYSSGTTGPPKCIVHGVGGTVLGAWKEIRLHRCLTEDSAALQFTTTGESVLLYLNKFLGYAFSASSVMVGVSR